MSKRISLWVFLLLALVGCRSPRPAGDALRTVKVAKVQSVGYVERDFAGMATADDAVNLAFKIAGQVASVDVSKGEYVNKGQLLAQLDPRDVELQVAADKAQYERAESQYERMKRLLSHEAVSRQEFETAKTASDASGFPVSLKLSRMEIVPYNISPGMTCQITIRTADTDASNVAISLTAVYAPAQGGTYAWVVEDGRVRCQAIELGAIFGHDMVSVTSGLELGDEVVTAGIYHLRDGQEVKIINR